MPLAASVQSDQKRNFDGFRSATKTLSTKFTVRFINTITIRDLMTDNSHICNDLKYISSLRVLVSSGKTIITNVSHERLK